MLEEFYITREASYFIPNGVTVLLKKNLTFSKLNIYIFGINWKWRYKELSVAPVYRSESLQTRTGE
jgi:hypothetical protein